MSSAENTQDGLVQTPAEVLEEENSMSSVPSLDESSVQVEAESIADATSMLATTSDAVSKPKNVRPIQETLHIPVTALDLIEYEWPIKSSERYFLQEQIADLLDVKSFKRKYADMTRRLVEVPEKEYLQVTFPAFSKTIGEHQMHGMTALRAIEVRELMANEYPSIYTEYQKAAVNRIKAELAEQQKAFDAIKNDKSKLEEMRKKAIQSASEFNSDLASIKKAERKHFWDLQTSIIQSPSNRWMVLPPERTRPHLYPCALITGQYQNYYKKFTPSELRRLPLNSVLDGHHLFPVKRPPSPPPIVVREEELLDSSTLPLPSTPLVKVKTEGGTGSRKNSATVPIGATPKGKKSNSEVCALCGNADELSPILKCSSCAIKVHTDCIDMPDHIVEVAQSYDWHCIECKRCTICAKPDNEDKLMFCDRCDRGYHTFCVGLDEPPTGLWECDKYCGGGDKSKTEEEGEPMEEGEGGEEEEVAGKRATRTPKTPKAGPPPKKKAKKEPASATKKTPAGKKKDVKVEAVEEVEGEEGREEERRDGEGGEVEGQEDEMDVPVLMKEEPMEEGGGGETSSSSKTASPEEESNGRKGAKTPKMKGEKKETPPPTATRRSARKVVPRVNRD
ncbi:hypothetical protein PFISCL1PPCAC_2531 [Pristionchus fissidentatus]|uniref:PHD-type domain-containing protein n=1 Tax=Pristionchus fissidentatus TaxID=1538716 RepID=A0AAV5UY27_9BILA|nr:hypothetical protein PFISCL1PPCAC_2531 [Pristionchus fissidentatus]